jgi:hypothetical protein
MKKEHMDWFHRLLVPDALRRHPTPQWRKSLPDEGSRLHRLGRLLWRAYRFSQTGRRAADLPGPGYDLVVILLAAAFGVAALFV